MSFYGTPLKHGKGVNKPFRSPLLRNDKNRDQGDGTPVSRRLSSTTKVDQNSMKSLGFKNPIRARESCSPLKPLEINSPSNPMRIEKISKSLEYSSSMKLLRHDALSKKFENNSPLKRIERNTFLKPPETNSHLMSSEGDSLTSHSTNNSSSNISKTDSIPNTLRNTSSLNEKKSNLLPKLKCTSGNLSTSKKNLESELRSPSCYLTSKSDGENSPEKPETTPPTSPMMNKIIESPEYQPVVKLQRLCSELQNIADINKKDLVLLVKRICDKQREIVELRAKMPTTKKHNFKEIVTSIEKWREAFMAALETLRESLAAKNGCSFSTSDVLKLLSIPNYIVYFSEEKNNYIFPKL